MENVEVKNEMVGETTSKKSKGLIVGMLVAATAAVGTLLFKKFKKNKVEVAEQPVSEKEIFDIDEEEIR